MSRSQTTEESQAPGRQEGRAKRFVALGHPRDCQQREPDATSLEVQMQDAWTGLFDALRAAGYEKSDLVQATVSVTKGGQQQLYRRVRDRMLKGHRAASAYLHVQALSKPEHWVEIEGWAEKR